MKKALFTRIIALSLVSVMMLFAVGCDMSALFDELDDLQDMTDLSKISTSNSEIDALLKDGISEGVLEIPTEKLTEKEDEAIEDGVPPEFFPPIEHAIVVKGHSTTVQVFSQTMQDYRVHTGVDIKSNYGDPVYAAADGTVEWIWKDNKMGNSVKIAHSGGYYSVYQNLQSVLGIKEGDTVTAGQRIAKVGDSAMMEIADDPHLHFEIIKNNMSLDPQKYIQFFTD